MQWYVLDLSALSNIVRNTHRTTQFGKNTDPDYRAAMRQRTHAAAEPFCTFSSTIFAAVAAAAAAELMAGMVA